MTEKGKWITIKGNHIFLKEGQTPEEAFDEYLSSNHLVDDEFGWFDRDTDMEFATDEEALEYEKEYDRKKSYLFNYEDNYYESDLEKPEENQDVPEDRGEYVFYMRWVEENDPYLAEKYQDEQYIVKNKSFKVNAKNINEAINLLNIPDGSEILSFKTPSMRRALEKRRQDGTRVNITGWNRNEIIDYVKKNIKK